MAKKNWLKDFQKLDSAVTGDYNPFAHTLRSPSPSFDSIFGNTWGFPRGFTMALCGFPKGGKTVISNAMIGQMHRDDPDSIAFKYETELRERAQLTPQQQAIWGIDSDRYQAFSTNRPTEIFDRIENDVAAACQKGMPLGLVVIDSVTGIRGRRDLNADSIETMQRGDHAATIQEGLKRILEVQRRYNFGLILTTHVRAEQDENKAKRNGGIRMAAGFAMQHHAEYFVFVERYLNKGSREDLLGQKIFEDTSVKDAAGNGETTGHKIRVTMKDSSFGCEGRQAIFTFDHQRGIINQHEEVFLLGTGRDIIEQPTQGYYAFGDKKWHGKPATLKAIQSDPALSAAILEQVRAADMAGRPIRPLFDDSAPPPDVIEEE